MAEVTAKIVTSQMETAVNLEQLRYLVIRGIDGKSAYDVAVSLGFEGTEQEWLDSLVGPQGPEGKNYGFQIDTDTETDGIIIQDPEMTVVKSVNGQSGNVMITADSLGAMKAASYAGANHPPMDDLTANELLDCVYSYIDNADKLFYGGMNAQYIADCTELSTVKAAVTSAGVDVSSASTLAEIKEIVDALTDVQIDSVRSALHVTGDWAKANPKAAVDYLLSGRKPMHCAWFAYLVSSGVRYEDSLFAGNANNGKLYDWGYGWPDLSVESYPKASVLAEYCDQKGYGFTPDSTDFHELRTGDLVFFANRDDTYDGISHVGVFLFHYQNYNGDGCVIAETDSTAGTATYPVNISKYKYDSTWMQKCTKAARLPYAGSGRVGQPENLFANEAGYRDDVVSIVADGNAVYALGKLRSGEVYRQNRFYTFAISLDREHIGDMIGIRGDHATNSGGFNYIDDRADNVYCMPVYSGTYKDGNNDRERITGGASFAGVEFREFRGGGAVAVTHEATVKWIACYEGIHHVGREGFVPYDNTLDLAAALSTLPAPAITEQPQDATIAPTESAVFSVTAGGYGIQYRWQYKKPGNDWANCTGATTGYNTSAITVEATKNNGSRDGYQYRCVVVDLNGKTTISNAATLTVEVS